MKSADAEARLVAALSEVIRLLPTVQLTIGAQLLPYVSHSWSSSQSSASLPSVLHDLYIFHLYANENQWAADTWLGSNILTDIIIVSSLCYFLSHGRTGFTPWVNVLSSSYQYAI